MTLEELLAQGAVQNQPSNAAITGVGQARPFRPTQFGENPKDQLTLAALSGVPFGMAAGMGQGIARPAAGSLVSQSLQQGAKSPVAQKTKEEIDEIIRKRLLSMRQAQQPSLRELLNRFNNVTGYGKINPGYGGGTGAGTAGAPLQELIQDYGRF
jgi:hypothetical protein